MNRFLENHILHEAQDIPLLGQALRGIESSSARPSQCQPELSWPPNDVDQAETPTGDSFSQEGRFCSDVRNKGNVQSNLTLMLFI